MKLHFGRPKIKGELLFYTDGVWVKYAGEPKRFQPYRVPRAVQRDVSSMWGISTSRKFFGLMFLGKPEEIEVTDD